LEFSTHLLRAFAKRYEGLVDSPNSLRPARRARERPALRDVAQAGPAGWLQGISRPFGTFEKPSLSEVLV